MEEIMQQLNNLSTNFSYYEFLNLLKTIDNLIKEGKLWKIDSQFLAPFWKIMSMINDNVMQDGHYVTLGEMLIDNSLLTKEKLSPTLLIYFYLKQKANLQLDSIGNEINFSSDLIKMGITELNGKSSLGLNFDHYNKLPSEEEYNYQIMHDLIHEITHLYQSKCKIDSPDIFERLVAYDEAIDTTIINKLLGGTDGNDYVIHESLLIEYMADEQADTYMLQTATQHPEYFSKEVIDEKLKEYQLKKRIYQDPRQNFQETLEFIRSYLLRRDDVKDKVEKIFQEIDSLIAMQQPTIKELQARGFSEKAWDAYYNIYTNTYYTYDGKNIVLADDTPRNITPNI